MSNLSGFVKRLRDIMRNDAGINGDAQRIEQIAWMLFLKVYDAKEQDWEWDDDNYTSIIPDTCRWQNWAHDDKSGTALTGEQLLNFVNNTLFPTLKKLPVDASTPIKKAIVQTTFADANNYMKDGVLLRQVINVIDELDLSDYEESHAFGEIYESILKELQSAGSAGEFYTPRAVTDFMAQMIQPKIGETMADKTTPRLIQFHTLKNAINPPFLGGFSVFGTVAAEAEQRSCQGDSLFSMILCNDRKAIVTE